MPLGFDFQVKYGLLSKCILVHHKSKVRNLTIKTWVFAVAAQGKTGNGKGTDVGV